jgi:hypothetical protein
MKVQQAITGKMKHMVFWKNAYSNWLTAVSASGSTTGCTRNGLDDRPSQFKNGVTTLSAGLTQVLQDGTNTYLYGVNRIAQVAETQTGLP